MKKSILIVLVGLLTICRVSSGANNLTKTQAVNHSSVEVKCQLLTVPVKVAKDTGNDWLGKEPSPPGVGALGGFFQKNQVDVLWKSLTGQSGVLIEEFGDVTVTSGTSGKIQKGYEFSYPLVYDTTAKPIKMGTVFLGTKLEVKPVVSNIQIDLYLNLETKSLIGLSQIYSIKEEDLLRKPTFEELVSTLPKHPIFNPHISNRSCESNVTLYTGQTVFLSMDDYENSDFLAKVPPWQMKLKDPSKRRFLIITAKVIDAPAANY
jgi:hypothetical protein